MRLLVPLLVSLSLFAAEIPISETVRYAPGDTNSVTRQFPVVAAGDDGFLVMWEERYFAGYAAPVALRAYDADGNPRQPAQTTLGFGRTPRAVWTGSEYLLVYAFNVRFSNYGPTVFALRVAADGTVLNDPGATLFENQGAYVLDLVWDGSYAWALLESGENQTILKLDRTGRLIESRHASGVTALAVTGPPPREPWLLSVRDGDLAASRPGGIATIEHTGVGEVVSLRGENGQTVDAFTIAPATARIRNLAWDRNAWIAAYGTCTVRFTSAADLTRTCTGASEVLDPWIAAGPRRTFTAWTEGEAQWSNGHGRVMTSGGIASIVPVAQGVPSATVDATGLLVAWVEQSRVHLGGLAHDGSRRAEQVLDPAVTDGVAIAAARDQSLLAFVENGVVRATILDARGVPILERIPLGEGSGPRVAAFGSQWMVMWRTNDDVVSTIVSASGNANGLRHHATSAPHAYSLGATDRGFVLVRSEGDRVIADWLDGNTVDLAVPVVPQVIRARPDGGLLLYVGTSLYVVDRNGALLARSVWTNERQILLGSVVELRGETTYIYAKQSRVYARDLASRARAVRH